MDERWLAQRVREGNRDTFEKIFHAYHARIYNYVCRLMGSNSRFDCEERASSDANGDCKT